MSNGILIVDGSKFSFGNNFFQNPLIISCFLLHWRVHFISCVSVALRVSL